MWLYVMYVSMAICHNIPLDKYDLWLACPIVCFQNNIQIGLQKWYLNYYYFLKISHTTAFSLLKSK